MATAESGVGAASAHPMADVLPVETEIYILPDGRVVVADLPMELAELAAALGTISPCATGGERPSAPRTVVGESPL